MQVLDNAIEQGLKAGLEARFLVIKPNSSAIEMTAFRNWYRRDSESVSLALSDTLRRLATIANESQTSGKLEVRVVNYLPPYLIIATDPHTQHGRLTVYFTSFRTPKERRPGFELTASEDHRWYSFFVTQFEEVWKEAELLDISLYLPPLSRPRGDKNK